MLSICRASTACWERTTKASIEFKDGVRAQVWVHPPKEFGTAFLYATGSKEHNVRLREMALAKNLSLSDHSFQEHLDGKGNILRDGRGSL